MKKLNKKSARDVIKGTANLVIDSGSDHFHLQEKVFARLFDFITYPFTVTDAYAELKKEAAAVGLSGRDDAIPDSFANNADEDSLDLYENTKHKTFALNYGQDQEGVDSEEERVR